MRIRSDVYNEQCYHNPTIIRFPASSLCTSCFSSQKITWRNDLIPLSCFLLILWENELFRTYKFLFHVVATLMNKWLAHAISALFNCFMNYTYFGVPNQLVFFSVELGSSLGVWIGPNILCGTEMEKKNNTINSKWKRTCFSLFVSLFSDRTSLL